MSVLQAMFRQVILHIPSSANNLSILLHICVAFFGVILFLFLLVTINCRKRHHFHFRFRFSESECASGSVYASSALQIASKLIITYIFAYLQLLFVGTNSVELPQTPPLSLSFPAELFESGRASGSVCLATSADVM